MSRARLEARRRQALRDLEELEAQVAAGEIDPAVARNLRATYRAEAEEAVAALDEWEEPPGQEPSGRSGRRALVGTVLVVAALVGVSLLAARSVVPRPAGGFVTGNEAGRDLSQVSNEEMEAVIAANPGVTPMRLALANRYFEEGEFSKAADHYLVVLEQQPETPSALARLGWMAHLSGEPEVASRFVERALALAPEYVEAKWYLANIYLYGLDRPEEARPLLEELAAVAELPAEVAAQVRAMLEEAGG